MERGTSFAFMLGEWARAVEHCRVLFPPVMSAAPSPHPAWRVGESGRESVHAGLTRIGKLTRTLPLYYHLRNARQVPRRVKDQDQDALRFFQGCAPSCARWYRRRDPRN